MLDSSKLKEFADDNFKFDENGGKLSKPVENTVGKGEIARYEQFLLFPQCFQKGYFPGASKMVSLCRNGLKLGISDSFHTLRRISLNLTHYYTVLHFDALKIYSCGKHFEKRRNCL